MKKKKRRKKLFKKISKNFKTKRTCQIIEKFILIKFGQILDKTSLFYIILIIYELNYKDFLEVLKIKLRSHAYYNINSIRNKYIKYSVYIIN